MSDVEMHIGYIILGIATISNFLWLASVDAKVKRLTDTKQDNP